MKKYMIALATSLLLTCVASPSVSLANTKNSVDTGEVSVKKTTTKSVKKIDKNKAKKKKRAAAVIAPVAIVNPIYEEPVAPAPAPAPTPAVKPRRVAAKPKVAKVEEKCHFLVWEVSCNPAPSTGTVLSSPSRKAPVQKGLDMVGLNARSDRQKLAKYFENKIEMNVDPARIPWCAAWANAVLADTGFATTASLQARSFLSYGINTKEPQEGDIVVFSRGKNQWAGHVGFYMDRVTLDGKDYIAVLGGNQAKGVNIAYYPASRVLGYRKAVTA